MNAVALQPAFKCFCRKLQCEGYSEFRVRFKLYLEQNEPQQANIGASEIMSFFKSVNNDEFDELLEQAVDIILASERIIFVGAGTSGALAKYGARFFSTSIFVPAMLPPFIIS